MNELIKAIVAAGEELRIEHGWTVNGDYEEVSEDCTFTKVIYKHIMNIDEIKQNRINSLKVELKSLGVDVGE